MTTDPTTSPPPPGALMVLGHMADLPLFSTYQGVDAPASLEEAWEVLADATYTTRRVVSKETIKTDIHYVDHETGRMTSAALTVSYVPGGRLLPRAAFVHALGYFAHQRTTSGQLAALLRGALKELLWPLKLKVSVKPTPSFGAASESVSEYNSEDKGPAFTLVEEMLRVFLTIDVPRRIEAIKADADAPSADEIKEARDAARTLIAQLSDGGLRIAQDVNTGGGDSLVLGQIAHAVAVASFEPGGVRFCGMDFEAWPPEPVEGSP